VDNSHGATGNPDTVLFATSGVAGQTVPVDIE
jgi:hypothetical protein